MKFLMEVFQQLQRPLNVCAVNMRAYMIIALFLLGIVSVIPTGYSVAADAASITAAVASGKPLSDIIKSSLAEGMKMKEIVAALIAAKVPAENIVYTAITEGLSSSDVIEAAIKAGGDVTQIVTAARSAGSSDSTTTKAAMSAGANPTTVAGALASVQTGAGYSLAPMPGRPALGSITGGGGGGGGKIVSPSRP